MDAEAMERVVSKVIESKLYNGRAPKVGLEPKTLFGLITTIIAVMSIGGTIMVMVFQTRATAAAEHAAIETKVEEHKELPGHPVLLERTAVIRQQQSADRDQIKQLNDNVIRIGEKLRVRMKKEPEDG